MGNRKRLVGVLVALVGVAVVVGVAAALLSGRDDPGPVDSATSDRRTQPDDQPGSTTPPDQTRPLARPDAGSDPKGSNEPPGAVAVRDHSIQMGIMAREYLTVTPETTDPAKLLPIVLVLHGFGVDRTQMMNTADWKGAVGRDRFVAVFPQGFGNSWNVGPCCPPSNVLKIDDKAFLDQVLGQVKSMPGVDPDRVYITGFSAGALMTYAVVCARPGVYSAMAPIGGSNILRCKPSKPISLLHQHSDPDPVVPYNGGPGLGQILASVTLPSVPDTVADWAAANGCDPTPATGAEGAGEERTTWSGCASGSTVELVRIPGLGHAWPKRGGYDGLEEVLKFFDLE